jgi:acyl-CoA thioesterase
VCETAWELGSARAGQLVANANWQRVGAAQAGRLIFAYRVAYDDGDMSWHHYTAEEVVVL